MTSRRVRGVQELRRSGAAGPHGRQTPREDEPCLCATAFTCMATTHDDRDREESQWASTSPTAAAWP